jgi:hypothetical protein
MRFGKGGVNDDRPVLFATQLIWATAAALRLAGRHAVRNAGASGDAVVEARVVGPHMLLGWGEGAFTETYSDSHLVREARSSLTLPLQALAGEMKDTIDATRLTATALFNAFGLAEVQHIAPDGALRTRYFPAAYEVADWADRNGVPATNDAAPE